MACRLLPPPVVRMVPRSLRFLGSLAVAAAVACGGRIEGTHSSSVACVPSSIGAGASCADAEAEDGTRPDGNGGGEDADAEELSCPAPPQVVAGAPCGAAHRDEVCPGSPSPCGDQVYYDVLACRQDPGSATWRWSPIAQTVCAVDSGSVETPSDATVEGGICSLLGTWQTSSAPWNGEPTDASIAFLADGTLSGFASYTGNFFGTYADDGGHFEILTTRGKDMTCGFTDDWSLQFSADCRNATLAPIGSGCTGARRYLDGNVRLARP